MKYSWSIKDSIRGAYIALLILICHAQLNAQLNESDTLKAQIKTNLHGIQQNGNVNLAIIRSRLEFVVKFSEFIVFKSQNNSLYQEFNNRKSDQEINSRNYLYFKPKQRIYPFAIAYVQTNYRLKIKGRYFTGAGITYQVIKKQHHTVKCSGSLVYEQTQYTSNIFNEDYYTGNYRISIWRPTLYVSGVHSLIKDYITLHYSAFWQPGISKNLILPLLVFVDWIQAEAGLDFYLLKGFSLTTQVLYFYEQVVPINIQLADIIYTFGLSYQFKKI